MALKDQLDKTPQRIQGMPCSIGQVLEELPSDEADALQQMMGPLGWSGRAIYEALVAEGHVVGLQTVNRHRSRACRCFQAKR